MELEKISTPMLAIKASEELANMNRTISKFDMVFCPELCRRADMFEEFDALPSFEDSKIRDVIEEAAYRLWVRVDPYDLPKEDFSERGEIALADGTRFTAPKTVDASALGYFDGLEYKAWNLVKDYMIKLGIRPLDVETVPDPDFATAKAVQDKVLEILEDAGLSISYAANCEDEEKRATGDEISSRESCEETNASNLPVAHGRGR